MAVPITKEPKIDRKADGYERLDLCATCLYANWGVYEVYHDEFYKNWYKLKPIAFHLSKYCKVEYKAKRKIILRCKEYIHESEQTFFGEKPFNDTHRTTYKESVKQAMVKQEQISEYIIHTMIQTHGDIIKLLPNPEDTKTCGYIRSAKDTPFKRDVIEFFVEFSKDKFRKKYTMNRTTFKRCAEMWGDDSDTWLGNELQLTVADQLVRGELKKVVYGVPLQVVKEKK